MNGSVLEQPVVQQIKTAQLPSTVETVTKVIEVEKMPVNSTSTSTTTTTTSHNSSQVQITNDKNLNQSSILVTEPVKIQTPAQSTNLRSEDKE